MKTYTVLKTMVMSAVILICCGAGCSSEKDAPKPDNVNSMLGEWKLIQITTYQQKSDGSTHKSVNLIADRGVKIIWDFKSNDDFLATNEKGEKQTAKWSLKIEKTTGTLIDKATLTFTGPFASQTAQALGKQTLDYGIVQGERDGKPSFIAGIQTTYNEELKLKMEIFYEYIKI